MDNSQFIERAKPEVIAADKETLIGLESKVEHLVGYGQMLKK